jgi:hypothetical protein
VPEPLVDARTLAGYLGVTVGYVYAHADELGARRLGSGPKARLRFSVAEVDSRLTACSASRESASPDCGTVEPQQRHRRSSGLGSGAELLPIRGLRGAA